MGLQTTRPGGIIRKEDVSIAKNYLDDEELETLNRIVKVRQSVTIDWTLRESARSKIKVMVKRILNKHGYPPDLQEEAVKTVLAQAELLCAEWV
jgi:type I restriction enzyme R subunit